MTIRHLVRSIVPVIAVAIAAACSDMGPDATPARVVLTPGTTATVASGASLVLTVAITNAGGSQLFGQSITWASSDPTIATVSSAGIVTGVLVGQTSITASVGAVTSTPLSVTVAPGAAARLVIRTQPAGGASGAALTTQPVLAVQDASGNLVSSSTATVTAVIATGGGTITGSTMTASGGLATFTSLALSGIVGDRTLTFSAPGLAPVTSVGVALGSGAPARLAIRTQPQGATSNAPFTTQPVIELRDEAGNLATSSNAIVTAGIGDGNGTLASATAQAANGVATFAGLTLIGAAGDYTLTFSANGVPTISSASFVLSGGP